MLTTPLRLILGGRYFDMYDNEMENVNKSKKILQDDYNNIVNDSPRLCEKVLWKNHKKSAFLPIVLENFLHMLVSKIMISVFNLKKSKSFSE